MNKYTQWGPLSFSSLTAFARSPLNFVHYKNRQRVETPAMRLGTLAHRMILEPTKFSETVTVWPGQRRGKDWTEYKAANEGMDIVTVPEMDTLTAILNSLKSNAAAMRIMATLTEREMMLEWPHNGVPHRGIIDGYGIGTLVDLKITNDVSERGLTRMIYERKYYVQCAMYCHALAYHGFDIDEAYIIAIESNAPHHVAVCRLAPHYIARGHDEWGAWLDSFRDWDGQPHHGHGADEMEIDAPPWAPIPEGMKR